MQQCQTNPAPDTNFAAPGRKLCGSPDAAPIPTGMAIPPSFAHLKCYGNRQPPPVSLSNQGALYAGLGENAQAEACFNRVLDLLPHNANVLYNRGVAHIRLEKFDSAYDDFSRVVTASASA